MAKEHLKFRCYRCNQLLGASSRRAGTVISCPRCSAELEVPRPGEPAPAASDALSPPRSRGKRSSAAKGPSGKVSSFMEEIAAAIPDDLAALRPEDIRVEAEFANLVVRTREPAVPVLPARAEAPREPPAQSVPAALQTVQTAQPVATPRPVDPRPQSEVRPGPPLSVAVEQVQPAAVMDAALPAIRVEAPAILAPGRETRPASEVVLQPATVLAWSLLVLMALPMAFLAGLLTGHFVWK